MGGDPALASQSSPTSKTLHTGWGEDSITQPRCALSRYFSAGRRCKLPMGIGAVGLLVLPLSADQLVGEKVCGQSKYQCQPPVVVPSSWKEHRHLREDAAQGALGLALSHHAIIAGSVLCSCHCDVGPLVAVCGLCPRLHWPICWSFPEGSHWNLSLAITSANRSPCYPLKIISWGPDYWNVYLELVILSCIFWFGSNSSSKGAGGKRR